MNYDPTKPSPIQVGTKMRGPWKDSGDSTVVLSINPLGIMVTDLVIRSKASLVYFIPWENVNEEDIIT